MAADDQHLVAYLISDEPQPWGDYGSILWNGMTGHLPRVEGKLQLERTAPLVPAISFPGPGTVLVRDDLKKHLLESGLTGLSFQPVVMARIVELHWEKWDRDASVPAEYPAGGEPENYILARPHSDRVAEEIGPIWELVLEGHAVVTMDPSRSKLDQVLDVLRAQGKQAGPRPAPKQPVSLPFTVAVDANAPDWFHARRGWTFVSARARDWLEKAAPGCVRFVAVASTPTT
jgi:hypothetical protein